MGTTLSSQSLVAAWEQFLTDYYKGRIEEAALNFPDVRSIEVDYNDIDRRDPNLAQYTLDHPRASIQSAEEAAKLIEVPVEPRPFLRVRIRNLARVNRYTVRKLRAEHLGKFVAIEGLIKKVVEVRPKLRDATFQCQRCGAVFNVTQEDQVLAEPKSCDEGQGGCGRDGPFKLLTEESKFIDSQKLEIQESHEDLRGGAQPERITIYLEEDLTGRLYPGDSVVINGIFRAQQRRQGSLKLAEFIKVVDCNSFEVQKFEFEEIDIRPEDVPDILEIAAKPDPYAIVRQSFAPEIYGMDDVKDALILSLFGGVAKEFVDGTRIRGDIHVLLVGDAGVAKSQTLRYLSKLSPRAIYTSGKGSSAAGLTATAVRDEFGEGQWSLEAGALVLADKGIACVHPASDILVDGRPASIASVFDEHGMVRATSKKGQLLEISRLQRPTTNLDLDSMKTREPTAELVARRQYRGKLLRATLASGLELRLTPDHLTLDANTLRWKPFQEFRVGDAVIGLQKLPPRFQPVRILDIVPDDWIVQPSKGEKDWLRRQLQRRHGSLAAVNRRFGLRREALSGRDALGVGPFRAILRDLGLYDDWAGRPFAYGRVARTERLRVGVVTPDLAYILGFVLGDGTLQSSRRRSTLSIVQSPVHRAYIKRILEATQRVTERPWSITSRSHSSIIGGKPVRGRSYNLKRGSSVLAYLYDWLERDDFANLFSLPQDALAAFLAGAFDADGCVSLRSCAKGGRRYVQPEIVFAVSNDVRANQRFLLALRRFDVYARIRPAVGVLHVEITSRRDIETLLEAMRPYSAKVRDVPARVRQISARHERIPVAPVQDILRSVSPSPTALLASGDWSTFHSVRSGKRTPTKTNLTRLARALEPCLTPMQKERLAALAGCDYATDSIVAIAEDDYDGYVYDLRVPDGESFMCDGAIIHNCIDEMDKMEETDQSAMHQAMEQQEISISKAGISATLKSRCAVIGAANPKTGRFDDFTPIVQQINMPPPLLSRFDLIFSLRDKPNKELDEKVARHILGTHRAGEVHEQRQKFPQGNFTEAQETLLMARIQPIVSEKMFRKYVAYAKRNYFPVLTDEAADKINAFYQTLRNQATGVIGITPRQIEALIRLAEASARIRLSQIADANDADRSIRIFTTYLKTVGWDAEAGSISIDIIAAGASSSQQDRMRRILEIIRRLHGESGGEGAKLSDILHEAQSTVPPISTDKVDEAIKILKERGSVFQPRSDRFAPL